jgi:NADPH:quinone reductase-like Zn-dependent oxidoreductase
MSKALYLQEVKGALKLEDANRYTPQQGEILIENVAVAQNPADWKQRGAIQKILLTIQMLDSLLKSSHTF